MTEPQNLAEAIAKLSEIAQTHLTTEVDPFDVGPSLVLIAGSVIINLERMASAVEKLQRQDEAYQAWLKESTTEVTGSTLAYVDHEDVEGTVPPSPWFTLTEEEQAQVEALRRGELVVIDPAKHDQPYGGYRPQGADLGDYIDPEQRMADGLVSDMFADHRERYVVGSQSGDPLNGWILDTLNPTLQVFKGPLEDCRVRAKELNAASTEGWGDPSMVSNDHIVAVEDPPVRSANYVRFVAFQAYKDPLSWYVQDNDLDPTKFVWGPGAQSQAIIRAAELNVPKTPAVDPNGGGRHA